MPLKKISSVSLLLIFGFYYETAKSQFCGCSPVLCCSMYGYCGFTEGYCGSGCKEGPCRITKIVTQKFFDGIISNASNGCAGKKFYTRDSFIEAARTNLEFNTSVTRLEIATMFAHFTYETQHFCKIEEVNGSSYDYCDENNLQYPCAQGKKYYGRGPMQLSWNYNYGSCGQSLGLDLLREPELVGSNPTVAFRASLWFWMNNVRPVLDQGFVATIKAINSLELSSEDQSAVSARVEYYTNYCKQLGVDPGIIDLPSRLTVFTLKNKCSHTVWAATLAGRGPRLGGGGFKLTSGASQKLQAPAGWSGRFWARTGCKFDASGNGRCITGDCGGLRCNGGAVPPVTLAEFTLVGDGGKDFYDVSLVDGYNVKLGIRPYGGYGDCRYAGCITDLNANCPNELKVMGPQNNVVACKSACAVFNTDQYCCRGAFNTPETCPPTNYSRIFKEACPIAYSYAYDDQTNTFTCSRANYEITFCP
ncbi:hypothetical protein CARUB_v10009026mg [Capsella rubella]|uniref:Chitin-binding type-1 domain-containing protein n=1 Tax=Capsella rubella TaxID=81985 RepID=R0INQ0_9BRAS|nr:endochitinase At2g43590 [Capsella rubella]EOA40300.1 hypothetical protein CARUB_v10009026mg [Capsella rubella]